LEPPELNRNPHLQFNGGTAVDASAAFVVGRMKFVWFNCDRLGVGPDYLAELTEAFLAQAAAGDECQTEFFG
jgi:hypothetical protein